MRGAGAGAVQARDSCRMSSEEYPLVEMEGAEVAVVTVVTEVTEVTEVAMAAGVRAAEQAEVATGVVTVGAAKVAAKVAAAMAREVRALVVGVAMVEVTVEVAKAAGETVGAEKVEVMVEAARVSRVQGTPRRHSSRMRHQQEDRCRSQYSVVGPVRQRAVQADCPAKVLRNTNHRSRPFHRDSSDQSNRRNHRRQH